MTSSSHTKVLKQIEGKPAKMQRYEKHNTPRERMFGKATKSCERCGNHRGHIGQYGLDLCRRCFRQIAQNIGFKKYS